MDIIILGAGQVGATLAENLVREENSITVVDTDLQQLDELQNRLDIRTVIGNASHPNVLQQAGADNADMLIAVTNSDECNLVACWVACFLFHTPTKIARIRSAHYLDQRQALFTHKRNIIDVFISPEQIVTDYVRRLIQNPGALQVLDFAEGKLRLVAVKPYFGGALVGQKLQSLQAYFPNIHVRVVAIFRGNRSIPISSETNIEIGDEVFFLAPREYVKDVMKALRKTESAFKRIMIAGGGNIGERLAQSLEKDFNVKIIDHNASRTQYLAETLTRATVLCGDASDRDLLLNENIEYIDVFCAITDDDEVNIMSCMQAKRLGAKQVLALITRATYVDLLEGSDIDIVISPQQTTIGSILTHIRRGDIVKVHSLRRGAAEAIEVIAHGDEDTSKVVGHAVADIKLPRGATIGAIVRGDQVLRFRDDTIIEPDDHIIIFLVDKKHIRDVERLFQVSLTFF